MEIHIQKGFGAGSSNDAENTLSNVTSIQSQLQSLYETCDDTLKMYDKLNNYNNINIKQTNEKVVRIQQTTATTNMNDSNYLKAMDKHSTLLQELHQRQTQTLPHVGTPSAANRNTKMNVAITNSDAAAMLATVSPTKSSTLNNSGVSGKTATILVSKSKTKTGLPLLLKNSIN